MKNWLWHKRLVWHPMARGEWQGCQELGLLVGLWRGDIVVDGSTSAARGFFGLAQHM